MCTSPVRLGAQPRLRLLCQGGLPLWRHHKRFRNEEHHWDTMVECAEKLCVLARRLCMRMHACRTEHTTANAMPHVAHARPAALSGQAERLGSCRHGCAFCRKKGYGAEAHKQPLSSAVSPSCSGRCGRSTARAHSLNATATCPLHPHPTPPHQHTTPTHHATTPANFSRSTADVASPQRRVFVATDSVEVRSTRAPSFNSDCTQTLVCVHAWTGTTRALEDSCMVAACHTRSDGGHCAERSATVDAMQHSSFVPIFTCTRMCRR